MITAEEAKKKVIEGHIINELTKENNYKELCEKVSNNIIENAKRECTTLRLNGDDVYPFKSRIINELENNGFNVEVHCSYTVTEIIEIKWK